MTAGPALTPALAFAVTTGVATFFAPCAYPLLPGYVGFYLGREGADLRGALARGVAAAAGAVAVVAAVSGLLVAVGRPLVSRIALFEPVAGAALIGLGLLVLGGRAPQVRVPLPARRRSVGGFALFGAGYAAAAAGCVVPFVVAVVAQALALDPAGAALVLGGYAGAAALPLVGVTLLAAVGADALTDLGGRAGSIERLGGAVMVVAGGWQLIAGLSYLGVI